MHKQTDRKTIDEELSNPFFKKRIIWMAFKQDWEKASLDSVNLHMIKVSSYSMLPLSTDTVVALIDRRLKNVEYRVEQRFPKTSPSFVVSFNCNYYGRNDDFAAAVFEELPDNYEKKDMVLEERKKRIAKGDLQKYLTVDGEWISNQTSLHKIKKRVGLTPWAKPNYVIFKDEMEDSPKDSVTMHQVRIGFSELEE